MKTSDFTDVAKTNPIKPNFIRLRRTCPPPAVSKGAPNSKTGKHAASREPSGYKAPQICFLAIFLFCQSDFEQLASSGEFGIDLQCLAVLLYRFVYFAFLF